MDGIEKLLKTSFAGAANQLTQLYVTSLQQQKQSYATGYTSAIESVTEFVNSCNSGVIQVDTLLDFLRKELNRPHVPTQNHNTTHNTSTNTSPSLSLYSQTTNINTSLLYTNNNKINSTNITQEQVHNNNNNNNNNINNNNSNINNNNSNIQKGTRTGFSFEAPTTMFSNMNMSMSMSMSNPSSSSSRTIPNFGSSPPSSSSPPPSSSSSSSSLDSQVSSSSLAFSTPSTIFTFNSTPEQPNSMANHQLLDLDNNNNNSNNEIDTTPTKKRPMLTPSAGHPNDLWDQLLKKVKIDL